MIPYELWYDIKPLVKYLKVFGKRCFIKRDEDGLGRFESRSDEGIFLGYSTHSKAYKCFNKRLKKVVESVHVRVDEDMYKGKQNSITHTEEPYVQDEDQSESEHEEEEPSKAPNIYLQKNHPKDQIIGSKNNGVQTRRRERNIEQVNFFLMVEMEPKTYDEANKSEK